MKTKISKSGGRWWAIIPRKNMFGVDIRSAATFMELLERIRQPKQVWMTPERLTALRRNLGMD